ncbi:hypothetical protein R1flu_020838 [Riccia fluitans]|uniref:Trichome birefringence-like N-terminal domain-containing protein n=1 Tax=Riccia fluitans TaxID=41844 RepID=A0ABD1ZMN0_9MARC
MKKSKEHSSVWNSRSAFRLKSLCLVVCLFGLILVLATRPISQSSLHGGTTGGDKSDGKVIPKGEAFLSKNKPLDSGSTLREEDSSDVEDTEDLDEENGVEKTAIAAADRTSADDDGEDGAETEKSETVLRQNPDGCDLFTGHWVADPLGPMYAYNSCRVLSQPQNCQDNGRPDNNYQFYKWKPQGCEIPRLDPIAFLKVMEGKTMGFVGDSLARNQYESLLCILLQVEDAKPTGNRNMQRWYFRNHKFTLIRIWSSFLVRQSSEPFSYAPDDSTKLFLDELDTYAEYIPRFDVVIISSGHWWMRKSAYIVDGEILGGYKWEPNVTEIDQGRAFSMAFETALRLIGEIPNYNGLIILKPYSPDHYQGGQWDTGGSCTGKTDPYSPEQAPRNSFNDMMRKRQMDALELVTKRLKTSKKRNGSKFTVLDVFEALNYRADGHPGPYRSKDPNKRTQRDEKGRPPPQDCLHWCMPGPVDTVNQLLFEILKRQLPKQMQ